MTHTWEASLGRAKGSIRPPTNAKAALSIHGSLLWLNCPSPFSDSSAMAALPLPGAYVVSTLQTGHCKYCWCNLCSTSALMRSPSHCLLCIVEAACTCPSPLCFVSQLAALWRAALHMG